MMGERLRPARGGRSRRPANVTPFAPGETSRPPRSPLPSLAKSLASRVFGIFASWRSPPSMSPARSRLRADRSTVRRSAAPPRSPAASRSSGTACEIVPRGRALRRSARRAPAPRSPAPRALRRAVRPGTPVRACAARRGLARGRRSPGWRGQRRAGAARRRGRPRPCAEQRRAEGGPHGLWNRRRCWRRRGAGNRCRRRGNDAIHVDDALARRRAERVPAGGARDGAGAERHGERQRAGDRGEGAGGANAGRRGSSCWLGRAAGVRRDGGAHGTEHPPEDARLGLCGHEIVRAFAVQQGAERGVQVLRFGRHGWPDCSLRTAAANSSRAA